LIGHREGNLNGKDGKELLIFEEATTTLQQAESAIVTNNIIQNQFW
jgi:hypothetical protein